MSSKINSPNGSDRKTRILIVEDEPAMVQGLRDNFEYEGYEVISAADGADGLSRAIADQPDQTFRLGKVSFGGIIKEVNLCMVTDAKIDDYVLVHVGVAISIIDEAEAQITFDYLKQIGEVDELSG